MTKLIIYLTFIPWLLYFFAVSKNTIKIFDNNVVNKVWLKKNLLNIFRFDNIVLFGIFVYFSLYYHDSNQIKLVNMLLFSSINLYLFMNTYYDKNRVLTKLKKENISILIIAMLISIIPLIYYIIFKNYTITCYILFIYSFLNYLVVYISEYINRTIIGIIKKNEIK